MRRNRLAVLAFAVAAALCACARHRTADPTSSEGVRPHVSLPSPSRPAAIAAANLYGFLTDGEDGCTCRVDLQELVTAFQEAHNTDPLRRQPGPSTELSTQGYLDAPTANALALYSGQWQPPCYGASRPCGPAPTNASSIRPGSRAQPSTPQVLKDRSLGGCQTADLGAPDGSSVCDELVSTESFLPPSSVEALGRAMREECRGRDAQGSLIREWVYEEKGCPKDARVVGCRLVERGRSDVVRLRWSYEGAASAQARQRCQQVRGVVVPP